MKRLLPLVLLLASACATDGLSDLCAGAAANSCELWSCEDYRAEGQKSWPGCKWEGGR